MLLFGSGSGSSVSTGGRARTTWLLRKHSKGVPIRSKTKGNYAHAAKARSIIQHDSDRFGHSGGTVDEWLPADTSDTDTTFTRRHSLNFLDELERLDPSQMPEVKRATTEDFGRVVVDKDHALRRWKDRAEMPNDNLVTSASNARPDSVGHQASIDNVQVALFINNLSPLHITHTEDVLAVISFHQKDAELFSQFGFATKAGSRDLRSVKEYEINRVYCPGDDRPEIKLVTYPTTDQPDGDYVHRATLSPTGKERVKDPHTRSPILDHYLSSTVNAAAGGLLGNSEPQLHFNGDFCVGGDSITGFHIQVNYAW
ncbi:hypothetical protein EDD18DRAFT_1100612 [Armillaria luteobubalina]|uniref:Uncharacterized protein n=1 Tax=Armillaria luteobubalina TaxID=153913 RepID=A0AA39TW42_9AGAR|nr:hypothetical protein EDD18DRAFT_1100612 [Armillaria luteobubalina]